MKLRCFFYFVAFVGTSLTAQIQQVNNGSLNELVFYVGTNTTQYDADAEGSPYLNDAFTPARINEINDTQFIRFNAVESTIELKDDEKILTLSPAYDYTIKLLDGSDRTYETHPFTNDTGNVETSFFEKLYASDKFALFLKERIIYAPAKKAKSSYEQDVPGKFKKGNTLFYITDIHGEGNGLIAFPKKKKNRALLFKGHAKAIEKFIKKEGLKMQTKEDIIALLNFYFSR